MPNITVYNLHTTGLVLPGSYYQNIILPGGSATFNVPDSDEYIGDARVQSLIANGYIRIVYSSADAIDRPLPQATTATLPTASNVATGSVYWDSTEETLVVSDGSTWVTPVIGESVEVTAAGTNVAANRLVGLDATGAVITSPNAAERWLGVSTEAITAAATGKVQVGGKVEVMPSSAIAAGNELIAAPGGFVAPFQAAAVSLGTAVAGADALDDINQGLLPSTVAVVCAGNETGNTVIVYGDVGGTYTVETITLGTAATYTSTNTFAVIYCLQVTALSTGTIDIQDNAAGNLIPQIAGATAARRYGAIIPDVVTDSEGQHVQIRAGGANASDVVLYGTDYAGTAQSEVVTMNGAAWVESTLAYRSLDFVFIGADGIAWNAGVTSQYDQQVEANERNEIRAFALEAEAVAGATVGVLLLGQGVGLPIGQAPMLYHTSQVAYGGGGGGPWTVNATVYGVAASDVIIATLNAATNATEVIRAERTAADTVTLTFPADPGANTLVGLTVWRP